MSSELGVERPTTLPLPESQEERRVHFGDVSSVCLIGNERRKQTATPCGRDPEFRPKRFRSASFSAGEFRHGFKRRKKYRVWPSKFLLGGNINDPLNLGSLEEREEVSQLGLVEAGAGVITKKSDAVRVIIPPNINDPLNLDVSSDNEDSLKNALLRQLRKRKRNRKRKRRLSEPSGESVETEAFRAELRGRSVDDSQIETSALPYSRSTPIIPEIQLPKIPPETLKLKPLTVNTELPTPTTTSTNATTTEERESTGPVTPVGTIKPSTSGFQRPVFKKQRNKSDNKIVSPVIPQPGVERKRHPSHSRLYLEKPHLSQENLKLPKKFNPKNELFQYGNYNKYYGYRNPDMSVDMRLDYLKPEWFEGKEVLDVGCNIGHVTLTVARDFKPKRVVGIDIDKKLVHIAQKNIKHYVKKGNMEETMFPKSMRLLYGPLKPPVSVNEVRCFPHNIKFVHANYVLESDELLETVRPEFDVIMCFSITKWIHLNWGDAGLKRFFRRIFYNLHPGGRLILEPQGWPSYNKRRKLTMRIFENYKNIRLFPEKFNDYLLHEVGFSTSEKMMTPQHTSRGFRRPIIVYTKAGYTTKSSSLEESYIRNVNVKQQRKMEVVSSDNKGAKAQAVTDKSDSSDKDTKAQAATDKGDKVEKPPVSEPNLNSAQSLELMETNEGSSCAESNSVNAETMDCCVSSSQCGDDVKRVDKEQEQGSVGEGVGEGNSSNVCDNNKAKQSPCEVGDNIHSTHSVDHKPKLCISESHLSTQSKNLNSSECCTKVARVSQTQGSPKTMDGGDALTKNSHPNDGCTQSESSEVVVRTPLGTTADSNTTCAAEIVNARQKQDTTVCDDDESKSKAVAGKVEGAPKHEGLLTLTKPRSPNIKETKDRP